MAVIINKLTVIAVILGALAVLGSSNPAVSTDKPVVSDDSQPAASTTASHVIPNANVRLDPNSLHRIPLYKDTEARHPLVETISKLMSEIKQNGTASASSTSTENSVKPVAEGPASTSVTEDNVTVVTSESKKKDSPPTAVTELPIPARCPQITGTADPTEPHHEKGDVGGLMALLEPSSSAKAAQRGCRFYIMHELMERTKEGDSDADKHVSDGDKTDVTLASCFKTCTDAYDQGTPLNKACQSGCSKAAAVTEAAKGNAPTSTDHESDSGLEREDITSDEELIPPGSHGTIHRSIIIIPINQFQGHEDTEGDSESTKDLEFTPSTGNSMMPNAVKMMLAMMHQMAERARQSMIGNGDSVGTGSQDPFKSISTGNDGAISMTRSMSVMITKDADGHSKMVVVHSVPRVHFTRFGSNDESEQDLLESSKTDSQAHSSSSSSSNSNSENDDDSSENQFDTDDFRVKFFGQLSSGGSQVVNPKTKQLGQDGSGQPQVYYYRSRLCYYLPRLFYLTLIILILYVIFWLFCAVPAALYRSGGPLSNRRGSQAAAGVAIIATGNDGKRKKFFFTKNQKYFQLNNKRGSTTSLPPPYPGEHAEEAEPLPAKQPLPQDNDVVDLNLNKPMTGSDNKN